MDTGGDSIVFCEFSNDINKVQGTIPLFNCHGHLNNCVTCITAEVVVSNLRRIRIRSNSTGAKHSSPKDHSGPQRFGNQLETPDRQRLPCGGKVPKSASVSALSLIINTGYYPLVYHC